MKIDDKLRHEELNGLTLHNLREMIAGATRVALVVNLDGGDPMEFSITADQYNTDPRWTGFRMKYPATATEVAQVRNNLFSALALNVTERSRAANARQAWQGY